MKKMNYPDPNSLWRHYKGGLYEIMFLSKHTETDEILVNMKSLHFGSYHSRPLSNFFETVEVDNDIVERFSKYQEDFDF